MPPVYDPVYKVGLWEVTFRDVTKRYRALDAVQARKKLFKALKVHKRYLNVVLKEAKVQVIEHTIRLSHI